MSANQTARTLGLVWCNAQTYHNRAVLGAEDIADPKHPLRFHQFITNMKRFTPSPLLADPQDGFEPVSPPEADLHAASSSQQGQPPPQHPAEQFSHSPSAGPRQVATALSGSASSSQRKADTSAPAYSDSVGSNSSGTSSSTSQGRETRAGSQSGTGRHNSLYRGLMNFDVVTFDVMSRTLSRGGPVPGGQVGTSPACIAKHLSGCL